MCTGKFARKECCAQIYVLTSWRWWRDGMKRAERSGKDVTGCCISTNKRDVTPAELAVLREERNLKDFTLAAPGSGRVPPKP